MEFKYEKKSVEKLKKNYSERIRKGYNGFIDLNDFLDWYNSEEKICKYCGLTEEESQKIVMTSILKSNRFPEDGKIGQGKSRGAWLEVDRLEPKGQYSRENAVLCCYFCNNDKSDVFSGQEYMKFRENRIEYLRDKLKK